MARRSTYSRTHDPETGVPVHSLNFTTLQVAIGFLIQFATLCTLVFGVLWVFAEPRVVEVIKRHDDERTMPRIVVLDAATALVVWATDDGTFTGEASIYEAEIAV